MTVSVKAAIKVVVRPFAKSAVVAALLSVVVATLLSTRGAAQGTGADMPEPDLCKQGLLDKCSEQVWPRNSFPKPGTERSKKFSNGDTLDCVSKGSNTPRNCELISKSPQQSSGNTPSQAATGSAGTPDDTPGQGLRLQCADLKTQLRRLTSEQQDVQSAVDREKDYLARTMLMTPAMLDEEIQILQTLQRNRLVNPTLTPSGYSPNYGLGLVDIEYNELDFLRDLRNNQTLGPELGGTSTQQMQARANKMVNEQQNWAKGLMQESDKEIQKVSDQIAKLNCDNVPSPNQSLQ